jgi:hypothetical protein
VTAITPERIAAVYDCLRTFPPYSAWNLPSSGAIIFKVTRNKNAIGNYTRYRRTSVHIIEVSESNVSLFSTLLAVVGHEMIHLHQAIEKTETGHTWHNAAFLKANKVVCVQFGWDEKLFI